MSNFWNSGFLAKADHPSYAKFQARLANDEIAHSIAVSNLQVTVEAGKDAWGRKRSQPCLVTVKIHLAKPFLTAAQADSLDASTVHYGILSKSIRSGIEARKGVYVGTDDLLGDVTEAIMGLTKDTELRAVEVDVFYPKGSLLGDGCGAVYYRSKDAQDVEFAWGIYLKNVRIPCIIGVNANERGQKQPVVVSLRLDPFIGVDDQYKVERKLVDFISDSSFETLEALSTQVVDQFSKIYHDDHNTFITLRVEKPMAVPFADAPVIEIRRRLVKRQ